MHPPSTNIIRKYQKYGNDWYKMGNGLHGTDIVRLGIICIYPSIYLDSLPAGPSVCRLVSCCMHLHTGAFGMYISWLRYILWISELDSATDATVVSVITCLVVTVTEKDQNEEHKAQVLTRLPSSFLHLERWLTLSQRSCGRPSLYVKVWPGLPITTSSTSAQMCCIYLLVGGFNHLEKY